MDPDGIFPGLDADQNGRPDINENVNRVPDYYEPFLLYEVSPDAYEYGDDMNNNAVIDVREDDQKADLPYDPDRRGGHLFGVFRPRKGMAVTVGFHRTNARFCRYSRRDAVRPLGIRASDSVSRRRLRRRTVEAGAGRNQGRRVRSGTESHLFRAGHHSPGSLDAGGTAQSAGRRRAPAGSPVDARQLGEHHLHAGSLHPRAEAEPGDELQVRQEFPAEHGGSAGQRGQRSGSGRQGRLRVEPVETAACDSTGQMAAAAPRRRRTTGSGNPRALFLPDSAPRISSLHAHHVEAGRPGISLSQKHFPQRGDSGIRLRFGSLRSHGVEHFILCRLPTQHPMPASSAGYGRSPTVRAATRTSTTHASFSGRSPVCGPPSDYSVPGRIPESQK